MFHSYFFEVTFTFIIIFGLLGSLVITLPDRTHGRRAAAAIDRPQRRHGFRHLPRVVEEQHSSSLRSLPRQRRRRRGRQGHAGGRASLAVERIDAPDAPTEGTPDIDLAFTTAYNAKSSAQQVLLRGAFYLSFWKSRKGLSEEVSYQISSGQKYRSAALR